MTFQKRNLLGAFRTAGEVEVPKDSSAPEPIPVEEHPRMPEPPTPPWERQLPMMPGWLPWIAAIGVVFVLGIAIGRSTVGAVNAQDADGDAADGARGEPSAGAGGEAWNAGENLVAGSGNRSDSFAPAAPGGSGRTSALSDPANTYTVVVATYGKTAEDFAWATHDHLLAEGIPVVPPIEVGDMVVILAGAAPQSGDLIALEKRIKALARDGTEGVYGDAYRERIDNLIDRD